MKIHSDLPPEEAQRFLENLSQRVLQNEDVKISGEVAGEISAPVLTIRIVDPYFRIFEMLAVIEKRAMERRNAAEKH